MGIGVNTLWDIELDLNTPSFDPGSAAAMRHPNAGVRGEGEPTVAHQAPSLACPAVGLSQCGRVPGE